MNLPLVPIDKANHAIYSVAIAAAVVVPMIHLGYASLAALVAMLVVLAFLLLKEGMDARGNFLATGDWRTGPHGVEAWDVYAGMIAALAVVLPVQIMVWVA